MQKAYIYNYIRVNSKIESNFGRYVIENNYNTNFDVNNDYKTLNAQNNIYNNSVLEE